MKLIGKRNLLRWNLPLLGNFCIENWTWFTWTPDKCKQNY